MLFPIKRVYLDHAAATPLCDEARVAMRAAESCYGNPGSMHAHGQAARALYMTAKKRIANLLAVQHTDIVVTASATEANNLALLGCIRAAVREGFRPHLITTTIEHSSVLQVALSEEMAHMADVTLVPPDKNGYIHADAVASAINERTVLVSVGWANGEIGVIQPLRAIVQAVRARENVLGGRIFIHSDAGQVGFAHSMQPHGVGVDMLTISSGKLYGPRGASVLFRTYGLPLSPRTYGGAQEYGIRPGTEDVVALTGFAAALVALEQRRKVEYMRLMALSSLFKKLFAVAFPDAVINGEGKDMLPHVVNVSVPRIDSEYITLMLDHKGISISTKSACVEAKGEPESHVVRECVRAIPDIHEREKQSWRQSATLRFSFGKATSESDVRMAVKILHECVAKSARKG